MLSGWKHIWLRHDHRAVGRNKFWMGGKPRPRVHRQRASANPRSAASAWPVPFSRPSRRVAAPLRGPAWVTVAYAPAGGAAPHHVIAVCLAIRIGAGCLQVLERSCQANEYKAHAQDHVLQAGGDERAAQAGPYTILNVFILDVARFGGVTDIQRESEARVGQAAERGLVREMGRVPRTVVGRDSKGGGERRGGGRSSVKACREEEAT